MKSIDDVLEEVEIRIDAYFFNDLSKNTILIVSEACDLQPERDRYEDPPEDVEDS
mgnify:CR=1 FL=1